MEYETLEQIACYTVMISFGLATLKVLAEPVIDNYRFRRINKEVERRQQEIYREAYFENLIEKAKREYP